MSTVSTSSFYDSAIYNMSALNTQAQNLQEQISTGSRLKNAYDDPVAAARMRALSRSDTLSDIDKSNAESAKSDLTMASDTLSNFSTIVARLQELTTQAATGTLNDAQRAGVGAEVSALRQNLIALANARDTRGQSLFGGNNGSQAYSIAANGTASYTGAATADTVSLGNGLTVTRGVTGPEFLNFTVNGSSTDLLAVVKSLGDALQGNGPVGTTPQAAAHAALDQLQAATNAISTAQTIVGSRLSWIDTTTAIRDQLGQQRTDDEASVGGTDIATTVSRLQQTMTILQASQASFVKLSSLNLFSMIN